MPWTMIVLFYRKKQLKFLEISDKIVTAVQKIIKETCRNVQVCLHRADEIFFMKSEKNSL